MHTVTRRLLPNAFAAAFIADPSREIRLPAEISLLEVIGTVPTLLFSFGMETEENISYLNRQFK